jgi:hypothetical protein
MITDTERIDFLASLNQNICNVTMPTTVVQRCVDGGLRSMIDECMRIHEETQPAPNPPSLDELRAALKIKREPSPF